MLTVRASSSHRSERGPETQHQRHHQDRHRGGTPSQMVGPRPERPSLGRSGRRAIAVSEAPASPAGALDRKAMVAVDRVARPGAGSPIAGPGRNHIHGPHGTHARTPGGFPAPGRISVAMTSLAVTCPHATMPVAEPVSLVAVYRQYGRGERRGVVRGGTAVTMLISWIVGLSVPERLAGGGVALGAGAAGLWPAARPAPDHPRRPRPGRSQGSDRERPRRAGRSRRDHRRDRRLLPPHQPLGHQRLPLRQHRLRPADGGGGRRHHPALPGRVDDPQLDLRHVDHDAPARTSSSATARRSPRRW